MPALRSAAVCLALSLAAASVSAQQPAPQARDATALRAPADFTEIVRRLSPSVVGVTTRAAADALSRDTTEGEGPLGDFFRRYFDNFGQQHRQQRRRAHYSASAAAIPMCSSP